MSESNTSRKRTAHEAFPDLHALHWLEHNLHHDEGEKLFAETAPVTIIIQGSSPILVHPSLLSSSGYFTSKLDQEALRGMPLFVFGINPTYFRTYVSWLYEREAEIPFENEQDEAGQHAFWRHWSGCYSLGRTLKDTLFRNALISVAIAKMIQHDTLPPHLIKTIYANSKDQSEHRVLVRDLAICTWRVWEFADAHKVGVEEFKEDLFRDLAVYLRENGVRRVSVREFLVGKEGRYHED